MFDLNQLAVFVHVAEAGSLTRASRLSGTVQPVLSRHISNLEIDLGGKLFNRTGRGFELTEFGQTFLPKAQALLDHAATLKAETHASMGEIGGEVRVGMLASFSGSLGIATLLETRSSLPKVRLKLFEGTIGRIEEWLDEGRIDIAVNYRDSQLALGDEVRIATVDTYLVGPPDSDILKYDTIRFAELAGLPLILSASPSGLRIMLDNLSVKHGVDLDVVCEVDSVKMHMDLARQGVGYAIMTPQAIRMKLEEDEVSYARIVEPEIQRHIVIGTSVKKVPSAAARRVVDILTASARHLLSENVPAKAD